MVIAIDGPAGAGKSSVARAVARELGFTYLDTGAMYRAVGLAASESGDPAARVAERIEIELGESVLVDGRDVTEAIRTPAVSEAASRVAADPGVRAALVARQQALMAEGDWVAEGRDIATVVAPDAVPVDTTGLTLDQVVAQVVTLVVEARVGNVAEVERHGRRSTGRRKP